MTTIEPTEINREVLRAYFEARACGAKPVDCYLAGVKVWRSANPDHLPAMAARRAVSLILAATVTLNVPQ
jgi:hypothetical protein